MKWLCLLLYLLLVIVFPRYTPTSGIWQTVWMETVPTMHITNVRINQASLLTVSIMVNTSGGDSSSGLAFNVMDATGTTVASANGTRAYDLF